MVLTQKDILSRYLKNMPDTVSSTLNIKTTKLKCQDIFFENLIEATKNNSKNKMDRYFYMSRVVFSQIATIYELQDETKFYEKLKFKLNKANYIEKKINEFIINSDRILSKKDKNTRKKLSKTLINSLNYYENQFDKFEKKFLIKTEMNKHFRSKIDNHQHPLLSEHIIIVGTKTKIPQFEKIFPIITILESIVHGIDDYIDENHQRKNKSRLDLMNVTLGIFMLSDYLLEIEKYSKNIFKNKLNNLIDLLRDCMFDLSIVPFIENESINKIAQSKNLTSEIEYVIKNLELRTKGTKDTLMSPIYVYLNKDNDLIELEKLIYLLRTQEIFLKDILDIKHDLKYKDHKGVTAIYKKHLKNKKLLKEQLISINNYYLTKATKIILEKNRYADSRKYLGEKIISIYEKTSKIIRAL